jgi:hypothetical protein
MQRLITVSLNGNERFFVAVLVDKIISTLCARPSTKFFMKKIYVVMEFQILEAENLHQIKDQINIASNCEFFISTCNQSPSL